MNKHPIKLGIDRSEVKATVVSYANNTKLTQDIKTKVFERDAYTCQCCGFVSKKYQEVLPKDMDMHNTDLDNLLTVCIFCHQCFYMDRINTMRSGVLIWMPEIEQADLHHIARSIYVARISQGPVADAARKALGVIMARREEGKKRLSTDDPFILSGVLQDYLTLGHYKLRHAKLDGIRLFPLDRRIIKEADLEFNQFPQILAYWRSKDGPFGGKTPPKWIGIYQEILSAA
ncbi:MAG: HNH endonuclease [Micavibrio sp.]|nr:HNH endonuclease [Micavibrio sp.]